MKKALYSLVILFFSTFSIFAQTKLDSLLNKAKSLKGDDYISVIQNISYEYENTDEQKALYYLNLALSKSKEWQLKKSEMIVFNELGNHFDGRDNFKAIAYYDSALVISDILKDDLQKRIELINKGGSFMKTGKPSEGIEALLAAEKICLASKDTLRLIGCYMNLANIYDDIKKYDEVDKYCKLSLEYLKKMKLTKKVERRFAQVYGTYGTSLRGRHKNKEAIIYMKKTAEIYERQGMLDNASIMYNNIGNAFYELNDLNSAESNYRKTQNIARNQNESYGIILSDINLGRLLIEKGEIENAKKLLEEGVDLSKKYGYPKEQIELYGFLSDISLISKDFKNYLKFDVLAEKMNDSLQNGSINEKVADMQVKYETAKKDQALAEQENQLFRQRILLTGLIVSILALIILGYLFYNRYRFKQKQLLQEAIIKEQQLGLNAVIEAQEAERKRIAKDLHDGIAQELVVLKLGFSRIQNKVEKALPEEASNLKNLNKQLDESCTEVRNIAHVMMPPTLETMGLVPSLEMLLRNTLHNLSIQSEFEHFSLPERLDEKTELGLYRITQELLNNIIKHAQANKVVLQLYQAGNNLIMRLEDNGKSFDFEEARKKGSMGLLNILSRVSTLSGTFSSEKGEQFGTISTVRIPV